MCNPFPPISKYLKYILGKAARSPLADTWPTSQPVSVQLWREFVAGHAGRNGMAPAVCHLQKKESYDIGHRDALGYHLDITWICCSAKTRERHQRALPALPGRERERAVCVCVKPANRHAGKSLQIEVSGQFYMFTRGAGCPCQYQPNEEACMWHWYHWRGPVTYKFECVSNCWTCFDVRLLQVQVHHQFAASGWLLRNPQGDDNLITNKNLKFHFRVSDYSQRCVCV